MLTRVKFSSWYEVSSFTQNGQTVAKATLINYDEACDSDHATFLVEGEYFEGVITTFHPTENDLRGDSAAPLEGYNIFKRRVYNDHPRHRRNRG